MPAGYVGSRCDGLMTSLEALPYASRTELRLVCPRVRRASAGLSIDLGLNYSGDGTNSLPRLGGTCLSLAVYVSNSGF